MLRGGASLLLAASVGLGGCSQGAEPAPTSAPEARRSSEGEAEKRPQAGGGSDQGRDGRGASKDGSGTEGWAGDASSSGTDRDGGSLSKEATAGGEGPTRTAAGAMRSDPPWDADRQGQTPAYADIRRATIWGPRRRIRFTLQTDGSIPSQRLAEGVDMTASFHLKMRSGDQHHIYAMGSKSGWKADLDNTGEFPGRFALDGDRFIFELPWARLGGASNFQWLARTSWMQAAADGSAEADFAFDQVPEYEKASYPE